MMPERRARTARYFMIVGLVVATLAVGLLLLRDTTPPLTAKALEQARALWQRGALPDYDIAVLKEVDTRPAERLVTEVRGGKASRLILNGSPVAAMDSYSVQGLFDTLDRELEMAGATTRLPGQPENASLKAAFHETLGVPLVVKRMASHLQSYVITVERIEAPGRQVIWKAK